MNNSKQVTRKNRFIDCGANIGQSIDWARKVFENDDLKIDSFEPLPRNIEVLRENYPESETLSIHAAAASQFDGEATFYCQNWGARTGSSLVEGKTSTNSEDACRVKTIDLAKWIKENILEDEIAVLKIDIEGAEYDVLPHLFDNKTQDLVDYWLVEFHGHKTPNCNKEVEAIAKNTVKVLADWAVLSKTEAALKECGLIG
jgi:FkbM family methyltransferase